MSKGATIGVGKSMSREAVSRGMTLKGVLLGLAGREAMGGHNFTVMVSMEGRPGPTASSLSTPCILHLSSSNRYHSRHA